GSPRRAANSSRPPPSPSPLPAPRPPGRAPGQPPDRPGLPPELPCQDFQPHAPCRVFGPFPDDARRGRPVDERAIGTRPVDTGADRRAGGRLGGGDRARLGVIPRRPVGHPPPPLLLAERLLRGDPRLSLAASGCGM